LNVTVWPYEVLGGRIWQLRQNLTSYDASYVALAETLSATLITLDRRLARSPGVECAIVSPV
jgi:predicted nucleic acid-binding protein